MNGKGGKPMRVRPATQADLEAVLLIYEGARRFMAQSGNPGQWGTRYPSRETVEADIAGERCYVCEEEGRLYAAFILVFGEDPTYRVIGRAHGRTTAPMPRSTVWPLRGKSAAWWM